MNNNNVMYWEEDGMLYAQWGDCALDDEDRYNGILIQVHIRSTKNKEADYKKVKEKLAIKYDQWIRDTR